MRRGPSYDRVYVADAATYDLANAAVVRIGGYGPSGGTLAVRHDPLHKPRSWVVEELVSVKRRKNAAKRKGVRRRPAVKLTQRKRLAKTVARRRNPVRRVNHHMEGAVRLSTAVEAVLYRHSWSRTKAPYKHKFGAGVTMYGLRDGSVMLKAAKPLWAMHKVEDDE